MSKEGDLMKIAYAELVKSISGWEPMHLQFMQYTVSFWYNTYVHQLNIVDRNYGLG